MTRELVDRMRTCAAAIEAGSGFPDMVAVDASRLLRIAADLLEPGPEPLGEPMEVLSAPPPSKPADTAPPSVAIWGGFLNATAQPCPSCGSIDARTVHRNGRRLQITCPVCEHHWDYGT
jgi:hypothetical protein